MEEETAAFQELNLIKKETNFYLQEFRVAAHRCRVASLSLLRSCRSLRDSSLRAADRLAAARAREPARSARAEGSARAIASDHRRRFVSYMCGACKWACTTTCVVPHPHPQSFLPSFFPSLLPCLLPCFFFSLVFLIFPLPHL